MNACQHNSSLCLILVALSDDAKQNCRSFNRRYLDHLETVQDIWNLEPRLRGVSTVIRMDNIHIAPFALALQSCLNGRTTNGGLARGLCGHVPATVQTLVKTEGTASTWDDQFGAPVPRTLPEGRRAAALAQAGGNWQMVDDVPATGYSTGQSTGDLEFTIRLRRN